MCCRENVTINTASLKHLDLTVACFPYTFRMMWLTGCVALRLKLGGQPGSLIPVASILGYVCLKDEKIGKKKKLLNADATPE